MTVLDQFKVGDFVKVGFYVEGRKVINQDQSVRYFNSIRANRIERISVSLPQGQQAQDNAPQAAPQPAQSQQSNLPF